MATDYDAPRRNAEDSDDADEVKAAVAARVSHDRQQPAVEEDDATAAESFELPGADLSHLELEVEVKPAQADEFTCMSCFLVHHRAALADPGKMLCRDCA